MIDKFICVHILKTAGTTLRENFLKPVYGESCLIDMSFKLKNKERNKEIKIKRLVDLENQSYPPDYENYDVIFGHFKGDKYIHLNRPMFSFVRHPVDRMVSNYHFFIRGNVFNRDNYKAPPLLEFSKKWRNHMTYVLGDISKYEYIGVVEHFEKSLERMCNILGVDCPSNIKSKRVNKAHVPDKISKDIRKEIEDMNLKDMELYNEVINKFH